MSHLLLNYTQDDAPNRTGYLHISVQVEGFAGSGQSYVSELWLTAFAEKLAAYPIPETGIVFEATDFVIEVVPLNSRGYLRVTVDFAAPTWGDLRQHARLQLATDYSAIDTLRKAL